jgi:hypothetical protein
MWKTSGTTGEYHSQMNLENYEKWLLKELITNVPLHSVFAVDIAPYHSVLLECTPS